MARKVPGGSNVFRFPIDHRVRASLEELERLAPSRSLVDTLIAEHGEEPRDVQAGFAREFAYQAWALEHGYGRDEAIIRLRTLVDAHVAHAIEACRAFQAAADRLISLEVRVGREDRLSASLRMELTAARADVRGRAIAARVTADGAYGAAAALAAYVRDGIGDELSVSASDPRQLALFGRLAS